MQGHRSSITTFTDNLNFDHGSTSSESPMDSQMPWNSVLHPVNHESLNPEWSLSETDPVATHSHHENQERKRENTWSVRSQTSLTLDPPQYEPSDILSSNNINQAHEDDEAFQISEHPNSVSEITEAGSGQSSDVSRISCKRKSLEMHVGQSSGAGSSNYFQHSERTMMENDHVSGNGPERLGVGGPISTGPFSTSSESSRRNFRLRINGSRYQDHLRGPTNLILPDPVNTDILPSSQIPSEISLHDHLLSLNSPPTQNGARSHTPFVRRNFQSRWAGPSSSREPMLYEEPTRNSLRSISEHPMFVPATEIGSVPLPQQPTNWDLAAANNNNNVAGNINPSEPSWSNRSRPQYSRRLSEIVRRSLLSTVGVESSGGQAVRLGSASVSGNLGRHLSGPGTGPGSSLSERLHADGAFGLPYSTRSLSGGGGDGEGRMSMMSEIRRVLDLMRRGEGLRFEDMMMLDHSAIFGMADMHDRHREMRLDVDNMSYEELLALEDRIGNVCTGLNEETIEKCLKLQTYMNGGADNLPELEPCSICREEYNDGEELGRLQCGHGFHGDCIKQWLMQKNLCPICKTTGLAT